MANPRLEEDLGGLTEDLALDEKLQGRGNQGGGGRGRGKGARGVRSGGGGGSAQNKEILVSKALSKLLRHAAGDAGVQLDSEGYAKLDQVMQWNRIKSLKVTFADIQTAVSDNAKKRFSMKPNPSIKPPPDPSSEDPSDWVIRANQGHSIAIDSAALLVPITLEAGNVPEIVVHGTYFAFYQAIVESGGLKKMTRNHIHMSTGLPEDKQGVISGMRKDAEVLIYVDIQKSLKDGDILWWISENGVVLTEGDENGVLSTKYFKKVVGRNLDVGTLWEDGKQVADLPESAKKARPPAGKGAAGRGNHPKGKK
ncbi:tRNA 2'-phosphotransferase [Lachnellula suecica]|uniref:2'-phosphotransferase n=1 Tax=Lachnellula suecica TaxID=602035 RepID=A0A8T9CI76_9HELO|nr:tRNA 2'-phosphotransferase [Lachnellula suecica]